MLSGIIGAKFNSVGRLDDFLCLFLGDNYCYYTRFEEAVYTTEFVLLTEHKWCFKYNGDVLLSSEDLDFCIGKTALTKNMLDATVTEYRLSPLNDLTVVFSNGVVFEQVRSSSKSKAWELTDHVNEKIVLCKDCNIEESELDA